MAMKVEHQGHQDLQRPSKDHHRGKHGTSLHTTKHCPNNPYGRGGGFRYPHVQSRWALFQLVHLLKHAVWWDRQVPGAQQSCLCSLKSTLWPAKSSVNLPPQRQF